MWKPRRGRDTGPFLGQYWPSLQIGKAAHILQKAAVRAVSDEGLPWTAEGRPPVAGLLSWLGSRSISGFWGRSECADSSSRKEPADLLLLRGVRWWQFLRVVVRRSCIAPFTLKKWVPAVAEAAGQNAWPEGKALWLRPRKCLSIQWNWFLGSAKPFLRVFLLSKKSNWLVISCSIQLFFYLLLQKYFLKCDRIPPSPRENS